MARIKKDEREEILESNRQKILAAAAGEIAQEGYNGANINRISQAAGFAKGTIYNYFPSKQVLMTELLSEFAQVHYDAVRTAVLAEEGPNQRLTRFFEAGFDFIAKNLASAHVMVQTIYGAHQDFKFLLYQAYQPMFQLVAEEIITPGVTAGIFREVDAASISTLLMTIYLGTASQVTDEGIFFLDSGLVAGFAQQALKMTS